MWLRRNVPAGTPRMVVLIIEGLIQLHMWNTSRALRGRRGQGRFSKSLQGSRPSHPDGSCLWLTDSLASQFSSARDKPSIPRCSGGFPDKGYYIIFGLISPHFLSPLILPAPYPLPDGPAPSLAVPCPQHIGLVSTSSALEVLPLPTGYRTAHQPGSLPNLTELHRHKGHIVSPSA